MGIKGQVKYRFQVYRNSSRLLGVGSALIHFPVGGGMVQIDWRCIALRDPVRRSPRRPAKIAISSPTAESEIPTAGHLRNKSERSGQNGIKNSETVTSSCGRLVTSRYLAPSLVRGHPISDLSLLAFLSLAKQILIVELASTLIRGRYEPRTV